MFDQKEAYFLKGSRLFVFFTLCPMRYALCGFLTRSNHGSQRSKPAERMSGQTTQLRGINTQYESIA
jgi:hypothetical protein